MKENSMNRIRQIAFWILASLSAVLSVNLFIQFSDVWYIQIMFGLMGMALEMIKLYLLVLAKDHFMKGGMKNELTAVLQGSVYVGLAVISIVASVGFTLVSIEEQTMQFEQRQQVSNFRIDSIEQEIEDNRNQIRIIQENASGLEYDAVERGDSANKQVRELQEANRELVDRIEELRSASAEIDNERQLTSGEMFVLLGQAVGLDGHDTMFYMMLMLVALLEISIAITAGNIQHHLVVKEDRYNLMAYIDALMDIGEGKVRLNSDKIVAEKTGLPLDECRRYKEMLQTTTYNGKPMVVTVQGASRAGYPKDKVKRILEFKLNLS